ncbi:hypothetical protein QFC19_000461 [Naganishia cerealis]|uniref:Uncharacterized protein n=1 Tax=Naganishia cerealis TaxID=610337 RepID=A0ACC2WP77_9TREE|nr:hypothetical protein QFC19_000461 [Naganishia cerealis]
MTVTQELSAPLFAVIGSTGTQGRSVIKALEESTKPYRIRAVTRDTSKPASKALERLGCHVVEADVGHLESLRAAFTGATYVFLMTNSDYADQSPDFDHEYSQGKNQFDAAFAAGVDVIAWSGIPSMKKLYGGKGKVDNFDVKARITTYARSLTSPSGIKPKIIDVQPGAYLTNYIIRGPPRPSPTDPNAFVFGLALPPGASLPVIDMEEDYGKYVVGPLEWALDGDKGRWVDIETVHAAPGYITPLDMAEAFMQASGKSVTYAAIPDEQLYGFMQSVAGARAAGCLVEMYKGIREIGYYGGDDLGPSNRHLARPARTFSEALNARPEAIKRIFEPEA